MAHVAARDMIRHRDAASGDLLSGLPRARRRAEALADGATILWGFAEPGWRAATLSCGVGLRGSPSTGSSRSPTDTIRSPVITGST